METFQFFLGGGDRCDPLVTFSGKHTEKSPHYLIRLKQEFDWTLFHMKKDFIFTSGH